MVSLLKGLLRRSGPVTLAMAGAGLALLAGLAFALQPLFTADPTPSGRTSFEPVDEAQALALDAHGILDTDRDSLPDSLENFVYGTDPERWNTSGSRLPDGWIAASGHDPLDPSVSHRSAASPPPELLPPAYRNAWPTEFAPSLETVYFFDRPADWDEPEQGAFDNGLDPADWDNNDDGIADGFLLHFGLDPLEADIGDKRLAGDEGLTVLEAYQYGTDPRSLDTDQDGIRDREEIQGPANPRHPAGPARFPATDPRRSDTAGAGVCDGYLRAHGLDPSKPQNSYSDLDLDGATTAEEFLWSKTRFPAEACSQGRGLDPQKRSTLGGPLPDGWLLRFKLDPLDAALAGRTTQKHDTDPQPKGIDAASTQGLPAVTLTYLDEYNFGRPPDWSEATNGPWWGGTDPSKLDTDADGLGDAWEIRGYSVAVITEPGATASTTASTQRHNTTSDPTKADTDGDGLTDGEEAWPALRQDPKMASNATDARRRDTDFDGLDDGAELGLRLGLDPTKADTAGDFLRDGRRLRLLQDRALAYASDLTYEYPGPPGVKRSAAQWAGEAKGAAKLAKPLSASDVANLLGPGGNVDGDNATNVLDKDIDGDTLLNGWEVEPALYAASAHGAGPLEAGRAASDPLNVDTDGDLLDDGWETQYGEPDYVVRRYNLDPSRWDSDADGIDDSREDPDRDSIAWYSYSSTGAPQPHVYAYTNKLEREFSTDPNLANSDGDELSDGWKVFWGRVYPGLGPSSAINIGARYPGGPPPGPMQIPATAKIPIAGQKQARDSPTSLIVDPAPQYDRFVADDTKVLAWEVPSSPMKVTTQGVERNVYPVHGTLRFTFQDAQRLRSNPYMADSDGDTMPDWWESLHATPLPGNVDAFGQERAGCASFGTAGPNATVPDGLQDPDLDQLPNRDEFTAGTDPLCADSDLGGLGDGEEVRRPTLKAMLPTDDRTILTNQVDSDKDGLYDFDELVGKAYDHLAPRIVRTQPDHPDSDGDGLLDGFNVPASGPGLDATDPVTKRFLDLGIAYRRDGGRFTFFGEASKSGDPVNPDDSGQGVPAGWLVAYGESPTAPTKDYRPWYTFARPAWWNMSAHGPWWGGADPYDYSTAGDVDDLLDVQDLDGDGLRDRDGSDLYEDPMPGANQPNQNRPGVDYAAFGLTAPAADASADDGGLPLLARRLLAQSYLNPRDVGLRAIQRGEPSADPIQRGTLCLQEVAVAGDASEIVIIKGTPSTVTGRVVRKAGDACDATSPVRGLAVEARLGTEPSQSFGAGFTGADGRFSFPLNVAPAQSATMPPYAAVFRGNTSGTLNWSADPAKVAAGARELTIRTYVTPSTVPFTQKVPAYSSAQMLLPVEVRAASNLTLRAPPSAITGETFEIALTLLDSGGSPRRDPVRVEWNGATYDVTPRTDGSADLELPSGGHDLAGPRTLKVTSVPSGSQISPGQATASVSLQRPATITLQAPTQADAGASITVNGRVTIPANPPQGATVIVNLTASSAPASTQTNLRADGTYSATLQLPAELAYGNHIITATLAATQTSSTAQAAPAVLRARSLPLFVGVSTSNLTVGQSQRITAILVEPDGATPLANQPVLVKLGFTEKTITTDSTGRIDVDLNAPVEAQPTLQTLRFAGDDKHAPARHATERLALTPTRLTIPQGTLPRGGTSAVSAFLADAEGRPITGAPVTLSWGGERPIRVLTDGSGVAQVLRSSPPGESLGPVIVRATYPGSADGAKAASEARNTWFIRTGVELSLPAGFLEAGAQPPGGALIDAGIQAPLRRSPVTVRVNEENPVNRVTDDSGRFAVLDAVAREAEPFVAHLRARYSGNDSYGEVETTSLLRVLSPVTMHARLPPTIVAGRATPIHVSLVDARGLLPSAGAVNATIGDLEVGASSPSDGVARPLLTLPADLRPGRVDLRINYAGSDTHAPTSQAFPVNVVAPLALDIEAPHVPAGQLATVRVTASVAGAPISNTPVHLHVEGVEGGLVAVTDDAGIATFAIQQGSTSARMMARFPGNESFSAASSATSLEPKVPATPLQQGVKILIWSAALAAVAFAAAAVILYRIRRNPLEGAFRQARRALVARGEYERQILFAYRILEDAAIAREVLAQPARTPRVLQEALQGTLPASVAPSLDRLVTLFENARYGHARLDHHHRDDAVAALDQIIEELWKRKVYGFDAYPLKHGVPS